MSDLTLHHSSPLALPEPRVPITIRLGVMSDVPFLDSLQKLHSKQVGWMPTKQFEGKIKAGHVLIAEMRNEECGTRNEETATGDLSSVPHSSFRVPRSPVGYLIGNDQYFKRDDVGIIYQLNVAPGRQRGWIGAALLKAQFERSAYGCKLYCCWCAQDIAANRFWEAMGFVPLAYRAGSESKGPKGSARVHIFWQKRIRQGDTGTPWWFPSQTSGGSIREDRLVLPIPPGTHWSDAKPLILPSADQGLRTKDLGLSEKPTRAKSSDKSLVLSPKSPGPRVLTGGLQFAPPQPAAPAKTPRQPRPKQKNDPRLVAAARELRDRWLERVNEDPSLLTAGGKYEVARLASPAGPDPGPLPGPHPNPLPGGEGVRLLPAA